MTALNQAFVSSVPLRLNLQPPRQKVIHHVRTSAPIARQSPVQPKPPPSTAPQPPSRPHLPPLPINNEPDPVPPTPPDQSFALLIALSIAALAISEVLPQTPSLFPASLDMPTDPDSVLSALNDFLSGPHFPVAAGMGISALVQALTGFGFAIVSVGALTQVPWIANSSIFNAVPPIAATLGALTGWLLILPEVKKVQWKEISILLIASTLTTPLGVLMLEVFDPALIIRVLGAVITGYVIYSFLGIQVPKQFGGKGGAWSMGFLAGALGGAFDITGPPLVLHAEARGWNATDFRRNVLTVVTINSSLVVLWDLMVGKLDDFYYRDFVGVAVPTTLIGVVLGKFLAERLDASGFKRIVLGTCLLMGVKLLLG